MNDFFLTPGVKGLENRNFDWSKNANKINEYTRRIFTCSRLVIETLEQCVKSVQSSKWPHWHENIKKHWWRSDVFIVNFEQIPHLFLVFHCWIWESVAGWVYRRPRSKGRGVKIMKHARAGTKLCNINQTSQTTTWKKPVSNLNSIQSEGFEQISIKCIEIFVS